MVNPGFGSAAGAAGYAGFYGETGVFGFTIGFDGFFGGFLIFCLNWTFLSLSAFKF